APSLRHPGGGIRLLQRWLGRRWPGVRPAAPPPPSWRGGGGRGGAGPRRRPAYRGGGGGGLRGGPAPPADPELASLAITGMAIGTLVGGLLQLAVQLPSLWRVGVRYRPILSFRDPALRQVLQLMAPATIGAAAVQVNVLVNSNFAS